MALINQAGVRYVNTDPATGRYIQAYISPRVAGQIRFVGSVKITADITRRVAQATAHRHHHVGLVLAHTRACVKSLQCSRGDIAAIFFVAYSTHDLGAECQ